MTELGLQLVNAVVKELYFGLDECVLCNGDFQLHLPHYIIEYKDGTCDPICLECIALAQIPDYSIVKDQVIHGEGQEPEKCFVCKEITTDPYSFLIGEYYSRAVCQECVKNVDEVWKCIKQTCIFVPVYLQVCYRDSDEILFKDFSPVENYSIPVELVSQITLTHYIMYINHVIRYGTKTIPSNFGSLRQWVYFTDFEYDSDDDMCKALLVDCSQKTNGRIAETSFNIFSPTEISIKIIYESIQDYLNSL